MLRLCSSLAFADGDNGIGSAGVYRNPVYHQSVFAVLIIGIVIRVVYLLHNAEDYALEDIKEQAPLSSNDTDTEPNNTNTPAVLNAKPARKVVVIPPSARRDIRHCFTVGPSSFALGFLVWNLDNVFCGRLTGWKRALGWPAAFLLEGHSWWHVLTVCFSSSWDGNWADWVGM